jgi:hypothetical protein
VRVTAVPSQMVPSLLAVPDVSVKAIAGLGNGLTVTEADTELKQLVVVLVTVTVYEVVEEGLTIMLSLVPPVDQPYITPEDGVVVRVTDVPLQIMPSLFTVPDDSE